MANRYVGYIRWTILDPKFRELCQFGRPLRKTWFCDRKNGRATRSKGRSGLLTEGLSVDQEAGIGRGSISVQMLLS